MGRYKLYMSLGLSVLLIVLMAIFVIAKPDAGVALWLMFGIIILFSMIAVVMNYSKLSNLKNRIDTLPETYQVVYIDAQEIIGLSAMSKTMKFETKQAILEIFEHAVIDNRDVEEVIGGDLKSFMDGFIEAAGGQYSFLYLFSYSSVLFMGYLLLMKVYKLIRDGFEISNFETENLDFGIVFTYALIAFVFFPWLMIIMKKASSEQWSGLKRSLILLPFIIPFGLMSMLIGVENNRLRGILDFELPLFNSPGAFFVGIVILIGLIILMRYAQKLHLKS
ncbi:MAG: DUF1048 domain-containing protein [Clostridiales bacterium]|nr:DUF1048 domain-containing protein [Clostridiales bacterium]